MKEKNYSGTIPVQIDGNKINVESSVDLEDIDSAKLHYEVAKKRLLDVNNWQKLAGEFLAGFQLTDASGNPVDSDLEEGMLFKIDIPGPGSVAGEGYDWVNVEKIEVFNTPDIESIGIRVRPVKNPKTDNNNIAHFYSSDATSTFTVTREKSIVTAAVYDRNTKTNQDTDQFTDQVRNAIIGFTGIVSFSRIQWKNLTDALIKQ